MRSRAPVNSKPQDHEEPSFLDEMSGVTPLQEKRVKPWKKRPPPRPLQVQPQEREVQEFVDVDITTHDFLEFRRSGIQHRLFRDLQRGAIPPQSTLDLHGSRVAEARSALAEFIRDSAGKGLRCVRIIHGKGQRSAAQQPILKQKLNQWLPQRREVLAFVSAPRRDGGTGVVYVLLSRKYQEHY